MIIYGVVVGICALGYAKFCDYATKTAFELYSRWRIGDLEDVVINNGVEDG